MAISYIGSNNSTGNNPTSDSFALPSGWQDGDVAVFWWYTYADTKTFTPPSGVTQKQQAAASGYGRLYIGYRVLQAGDTTFAWTSSSVTNSTTIWGISVFRGVNPIGDPFEAQSGAPATFANAINPNPPAVTTLTDKVYVIAIFGKRNDYTSITPPTGYTSAGSNSSTTGSDASAGVAHKEKTPAGSEDPAAWTLGGGATTDDGYVWTGALTRKGNPALLYNSFPSSSVVNLHCPSCGETNHNNRYWFQATLSAGINNIAIPTHTSLDTGSPCVDSGELIRLKRTAEETSRGDT